MKFTQRLKYSLKILVITLIATVVATRTVIDIGTTSNDIGSNTIVVPNIVGGTIVPNKSIYPSYANVIGSGYLCGGTLIHPDILLTAAQCYFEYGYDRFIAIGATNLNGSDAHAILSARQRYMHPEYIGAFKQHNPRGQ
jgi:secreted trypsin-like serine protease